MRLLCGSCAAPVLDCRGSVPFVTKPLLASLFSATTPGCSYSLHPIVSPRAKLSAAAHSHFITSAVRRCPPRSSQPNLGYTSLPAPQLTASPRTHLAAHPAACSLPPSLRLNVAARLAACAKPLPHVAARRTAALRAAAHPAAHSHFRHLGCTSLPAPQLTAKPRLLVAACPAAHSFTSAQLPAPCSLRCICLLLRSPLQLAIRVWCSSAARSSQLAF